MLGVVGEKIPLWYFQCYLLARINMGMFPNLAGVPKDVDSIPKAILATDFQLFQQS